MPRNHSFIFPANRFVIDNALRCPPQQRRYSHGRRASPGLKQRGKEGVLRQNQREARVATVRRPVGVPCGAQQSQAVAAKISGVPRTQVWCRGVCAATEEPASAPRQSTERLRAVITPDAPAFTL